VFSFEVSLNVVSIPYKFELLLNTLHVWDIRGTQSAETLALYADDCLDLTQRLQAAVTRRDMKSRAGHYEEYHLLGREMLYLVEVPLRFVVNYCYHFQDRRIS
jgi:hypothetical protein